MAQAGDKVADPAHEQQRWMASAETCPPANPLNSAHQPLWGTDQFRILVMHYPRPDPRYGSTALVQPGCSGSLSGLGCAVMHAALLGCSGWWVVPG